MTVRFILEPTISIICEPSFNAWDAEHFRTETIDVEHFRTETILDRNPSMLSDEVYGQDVIEFAGRTCYQSFGKGRPHAEHIRNLVQSGHWSCLEHANYTYAIAGISRACSHELVRHRHLSPSQLSQRYVDHREHNLGFVVPVELVDGWRKAGECNTWEDRISTIFGWYCDRLEYLTSHGVSRKIAHDMARSVLPECTETRMTLTGNVRAWLEFFGKRCQPEAASEIRRLACRIYEDLAPRLPDVFACFEKDDLPDGTFSIRKKSAE